MRLIDIDELKNQMFKGGYDGKWTKAEMLNIIDSQLTAYDAEKVIEKLEVIRERRQYDAERSLHNGNEFMEYGYNCEISGIDKAIYIVKGGGKDE